MRRYAKQNLICAMVVLTTMAACATDGPPKYDVIVSQDADLIFEDGHKASVKAKESFDTEGRSVFIHSQGRVSMLLVHGEPQDGQVKVDLKPLDNWKGAYLERKLNERLDQMINATTNIQKLMQTSDFSAALSYTEKVQAQYPGITYFSFLKAGILVALNRKEDAIKILTTALMDFPDHKDGRTLYKRLTGKEFDRELLGVESKESKTEPIVRDEDPNDSTTEEITVRSDVATDKSETDEAEEIESGEAQTDDSDSSPSSADQESE